uniref:C-type lectin domain-containing protein n=1 Tax=Acrobeloides nanus TaxID=290746 RepID=A0A914CTP5_9BILA
MTCQSANCDQSCQGCGSCNSGNTCGLFYAYSCYDCNGCGYCDCSCNDWSISTCGSHEHVWIGLTDKNNNGDYEWSDGSPFNYQLWAHPPTNGQCAVLVADQDTSYQQLGSNFFQHWDPISCSTNVRSFICKKPAIVLN